MSETTSRWPSPSNKPKKKGRESWQRWSKDCSKKSTTRRHLSKNYAAMQKAAKEKYDEELRQLKTIYDDAQPKADQEVEAERTKLQQERQDVDRFMTRAALRPQRAGIPSPGPHPTGLRRSGLLIEGGPPLLRSAALASTPTGRRQRNTRKNPLRRTRQGHCGF